MTHPREDVVVARYLVTAQFGLIGLLAVVPRGHGWPVPVGLQVVLAVLVLVGVAIMGLGATSLGKGLTATPLPNQHAQLRTGGLYRFVRHPIYTGLLLSATAYALASGSVARVVVLALLIALLNVKARWEEARLARRFDGYAAYAARTPRFVPLRVRR
ncbi:isoprenylcysteine carboxylmethyltransferase family protein [Cellulomonas sp. P24]|uniref:methyltransferase family protein n=1 Tax=Cellulomonas sp. P24 TaxID=2885206 RepID=UPI00216AD7B3|nr:NnrU family protein [Cellulomonas sp. P24]MCR6492600.1 hypothetical protein [Cellulomonas sp. P24]